tara:strand:- start:3383 stop:4003 length:621 start_codon:yes stop_codon:yes gene_type:complete
MSSIYKKNNDTLNIEIAIELDRGKSVNEIAKKFNVSKNFVKQINKNFFLVDSKKKIPKKRRFSNDEKSVLVERISNGESLEFISYEQDITENTLRRWCKSTGVIIPRNIEKISSKEKKEIRELLEKNDRQYIARLYNISDDTIEELNTPVHSNLDTETLTYLFEVLRENPNCSSKKICKIMNNEGFFIKEEEAISYKKRLISLEIL